MSAILPAVIPCNFAVLEVGRGSPLSGKKSKVLVFQSSASFLAVIEREVSRIRDGSPVTTPSRFVLVNNVDAEQEQANRDALCPLGQFAARKPLPRTWSPSTSHSGR